MHITKTTLRPQCHLDELVNITYGLYNWDQQAEAKAGEEKEGRNPGMPKWMATLQGRASPEEHPDFTAQKRALC